MNKLEDLGFAKIDRSKYGFVEYIRWATDHNYCDKVKIEKSSGKAEVHSGKTLDIHYANEVEVSLTPEDLIAIAIECIKGRDRE